MTDFEKKLIEFVYNTMCGQESGIYKTILDNKLEIPLITLNTPLVVEIFSEAITEYLNQCYRSLILKNDVFVLESFKKLKDLSSEKNHSYFCLLKIVANLIYYFNRRIVRENLDISSYNKYMTSFTNEFNNIYSSNVHEIRTKFNHTCNDTQNIEKMNPNIDMFTNFEDMNS